MALERSTIENALRDAKGNITKAAKLLGASRRTLQNRMREYGMERGKSGRRKRRLPYGKPARAWATGGAIAAAGVIGLLAIRRSKTT